MGQVQTRILCVIIIDAHSHYLIKYGKERARERERERNRSANEQVLYIYIYYISTPPDDTPCLWTEGPQATGQIGLTPGML